MPIVSAATDRKRIPSRLAGLFLLFHLPLAAQDVWLTHGVHKLWADSVPSSAPLHLYAAGNEWEGFQLGIRSGRDLTNIRITAASLKGPSGQLSAPVIYRQHRIPVTATPHPRYGKLGAVPDALIPLIHPVTGQPTAGLYGGNRFTLEAGDSIGFWFDLYVPAGTAAGVYKGSITVSADGLPAETLPYALTVRAFDLPRQQALTGCFQLSEHSVHASHKLPNRAYPVPEQLPHDYELLLHAHKLDSWSPLTGFDYTPNRVKVSVVDGKVYVDWREYDRLLDHYMSGAAYPDRRRPQCLFVPYWMPVTDTDGSYAPRLTRENAGTFDEGLFAQWLRELHRYLKEKDLLHKALLFYIDEPFYEPWKYNMFRRIATLAKRHAPGLNVMLTDGLKTHPTPRTRQIAELVDVWDPVTFQVSNRDLAMRYRQRREQGHFDLWCMTLENASPDQALPNLFPEFDMLFHRQWGVMSWNLGFSGIEWWQTIVWWDQQHEQRLDPWTSYRAFPSYHQPLNAEGRLFYPGTPDAIGGPDIPVASLRLKALRDAVEDYAYIALLQSVHETPLNADTVHTQHRWKARAMTQPMAVGSPTWHWWEGNATAFRNWRQDLGKTLEQRLNKAP